MDQPAQALECSLRVFAVMLTPAILYLTLVDILADRGCGVGVVPFLAMASVALVLQFVNFAPSVVPTNRGRQFARVGFFRLLAFSSLIIVRTSWQVSGQFTKAISILVLTSFTIQQTPIIKQTIIIIHVNLKILRGLSISNRRRQISELLRVHNRAMEQKIKRKTKLIKIGLVSIPGRDSSPSHLHS